jgi:hypothetical protein
MEEERRTPTLATMYCALGPVASLLMSSTAWLIKERIGRKEERNGAEEECVDHHSSEVILNKRKRMLALL